MARYDVLVVGGGPAGSTTAYRLAAAGASVVLVDKARFPRDKPCGGGMTMRAVRQCPVDPSPVVEQEVDSVELRFRYQAFVVRQSQAPLIWMTQRRRLDAFLLDAAREQGAEVREGETVDATSFDADVVVGADGANGTTAKAFGLGAGILHGVAFEGNASYSTLSRERYSGRAVIELADIPGGYGWVFPKGDHANVGVGGWQQPGSELRAHLRRLCEAHGLDADELTEMRGHRLPLRREGAKIAGERTLLVGDAVGLVDPVSGDGMYECFVSSRHATDAILELLAGRATTLEPYGAAVDDALGSLHSASWKLKQALDRFPRASWQVARTALLWSTIERMLDGRLVSPTERRGVARLPLRVLAALGR